MLLQALISFLGAYLALDLARRLVNAPASEHGRWVLSAGTVIGATAWGCQVLQLHLLALPFTVGVHRLATVASLLCACVAAVAWLAMSPRVAGFNAGRTAVGAATYAMLSTAALATGLAAAGLQPAPPWRPEFLMAAVLIQAGSAAASWVLLWRLGEAAVSDPYHRQARQAACAAVLAMGQVLGMRLVMAGIDPLALDRSAYEDQLDLGGLHMLAIVGLPLLLGLGMVFSKIEARMRASLDSARTAMHQQQMVDATTGLANRASMETATANAVGAAHRDSTRVALAYVGLDGFRRANELLGQDGGDRMLRHLAERLKQLAHPHLVARQGGDEFVILVAGNPSNEQITGLAAHALEVLAKPYSEGGIEASVTASIGIALYPDHGGPATLMSHANVAMRSAKILGGASYSFFDPRSVERAREQAELLRDLRQALGKGELELIYQPKIHAPSGQVTGVEALMRWTHPRRGMVNPAVFVPLAERYGLINTLGNWVIDEACRQAGAWRDEGLRMRVAINLSVPQLSQPDLAQRIAAALDRHHINPNLLTCEITESVAMEDTEQVIHIFSELSRVGVHISIDDFGSGYSSLGSLRKLPANELKIDRSFVLDLANSEDARNVVAHVVSLAKSLNLQVVAEGVETDTQYHVLRQLGVDQVQGYLFAKPMSASALTQWAMNDQGPKEIQFRDSLFKMSTMATL